MEEETKLVTLSEGLAQAVRMVAAGEMSGEELAEVCDAIEQLQDKGEE